MFRQLDEAFRAGTTECEFRLLFGPSSPPPSPRSHLHPALSPDLTQLQRQRQQDPAPQQLMAAVCGLQGHVVQLSAPNSSLVQVLQGSVRQEMQPVSQQYVRVVDGERERGRKEGGEGKGGRKEGGRKEGRGEGKRGYLPLPYGDCTHKLNCLMDTQPSTHTSAPSSP